MLVLARTADKIRQGTSAAKDAVVIEMADYVERIGKNVIAENPSIAPGRLLQEIVASLPPAICIQLLAKSAGTSASCRVQVGIYGPVDQKVLRGEKCEASWNPTRHQTTDVA